MKYDLVITGGTIVTASDTFIHCRYRYQ